MKTIPGLWLLVAILALGAMGCSGTSAINLGTACGKETCESSQECVLETYCLFSCVETTTDCVALKGRGYSCISGYCQHPSRILYTGQPEGDGDEPVNLDGDIVNGDNQPDGDQPELVPFCEARDEICDGLDNDCDGVKDNGLTCDCYPVGATKMCGVAMNDQSLASPCHPGLQLCEETNGGMAWSACQWQVDPSTEVCDNMDNNCNGVDDETEFGFAVNIDHCGGCNQRCALANALPRCVSGNCAVDECEVGFFDLDGNATNGCEYGPCEPTQSFEICTNHRDDDCNGVTDEEACGCEPGDLNVCGHALVGICHPGVQTCNEQGSWGNCVGEQTSLASEFCNNLDDNCDGVGDAVEFHFASNPYNCGSCGHVCEFANALPLCVNSVCVIGPCLAGYYNNNSLATDGCEFGPCVKDAPWEICGDLRDNDCDGQTDEADCGCRSGAVESCGHPTIGECLVGNRTCDLRGSWGTCTAAREPSPELCDGLDNDCDGEVDENYFVGAPCRGLGVCGLGHYECNGLQDYHCDTMPGGSNDQSTPEIANLANCANRRDLDCDGEMLELDNGCPCDPGERRACGSSNTPQCQFGWQYCGRDSRWEAECIGSIEPETELCDGLDNDCDGLIDEDFHVGVECRGMGVCGLQLGVFECLDEDTPICSVSPGGSHDLSSLESCSDLLDNDCDGSTNEGCGCNSLANTPPQDCGANNQTGECRFGKQTCQPNGTWSTCSGARTATVETCNQKDDDCNGVIDNGFMVLADTENCGRCGNICPAYEHSSRLCVSGVCQMGACDLFYYNPDGNAANGCEYGPCIPTHGGIEQLDGIDNDCDGVVDEGL